MPPKHRATRYAFRAEDAPEEVIEALRNADYSHLNPSLNRLMDDDEGKSKI